MNENRQPTMQALRRLARGLVQPGGGSDDLVQEAWLVALRARHGVEVLEPESWLRGVLRRLAGRARRDADRRAERERAAARPEAQPSAAEVAARLELAQRVLAALNTLEEPYRAALVLRFFDELPPREIARRLGSNVNTVRTHVRRGLERLRQRLEGADGRDRDELLAALVPFLRGAIVPAPSSPSFPSSFLGSRTLLMKATLLLGAILWFGFQVADPSRSGHPSASGSGSRVAGSLAPIALTPAAGPEQLSSVPRPAVTRTELGAGFVGLAGRVVDAVSGEPVPTFRVMALLIHARSSRFQWVMTYSPALLKWVTFESGEGDWQIEWNELGKPVGLVIEAPGYARALVPRTEAAVDPDPASLVVRLQHGARIAGQVLDRAGGQPLVDATVRRFTAEEPLDQERWSELAVLETKTDANGRFVLENVPPGPTSLGVEGAGHLAVIDGPFEIEPGSTLERRIELGGAARVEGRLLDAGGRGLEGRSVSLWGWSATGEQAPFYGKTEVGGRFRFENVPEGSYYLSCKPIEGKSCADLVRHLVPRRDATLQVDLQPDGPGILRGRFDSTLGPNEHVRVFVTPDPGARGDVGDEIILWDGQRGTLVENGVFEIAGLRPGHYVVAVSVYPKGEERIVRASVLVPATGVAEVELTLR